jgi:hypothetical protein
MVAKKVDDNLGFEHPTGRIEIQSASLYERRDKTPKLTEIS